MQLSCPLRGISSFSKQTFYFILLFHTARNIFVSTVSSYKLIKTSCLRILLKNPALVVAFIHKCRSKGRIDNLLFLFWPNCFKVYIVDLA